MKKYITYFIAICVILFAVYSIGYAETHYSEKAEVTMVIGDLVRAKDTNGNCWEFYGKDFKRGDKVRLIMYNNHTELNIYDDEVANVKKF